MMVRWVLQAALGGRSARRSRPSVPSPCSWSSSTTCGRTRCRADSRRRRLLRHLRLPDHRAAVRERRADGPHLARRVLGSTHPTDSCPAAMLVLAIAWLPVVTRACAARLGRTTSRRRSRGALTSRTGSSRRSPRRLLGSRERPRRCSTSGRSRSRSSSTSLWPMLILLALAMGRRWIAPALGAVALGELRVVAARHGSRPGLRLLRDHGTGLGVRGRGAARRRGRRSVRPASCPLWGSCSIGAGAFALSGDTPFPGGRGAPARRRCLGRHPWAARCGPARSRSSATSPTPCTSGTARADRLRAGRGTGGAARALTRGLRAGRRRSPSRIRCVACGSLHGGRSREQRSRPPPSSSSPLRGRPRSRTGCGAIGRRSL